MLAKTHLAAFALSLLSAALLVPGVRKLAGELHLAADGPDERERAVPRLGGAAVALAFFAPIAGLHVYLNPVGRALVEESGLLWALFAGGATTLALGVYEDIRGPHRRVQLGGQILVSLAAFALGVRVETVALPGVGAVGLGLYALPVTVLWFVLVMSAVDLLADLEGAASAAYLFSALALLFASLQGGFVVQGVLAAALAGAALGLLFRGLSTVTLSAGDSGSHFVGYVLALLSAASASKGVVLVAVLVPLVALGLPAGEASAAVWRRLRSGEPVPRGVGLLLCWSCAVIAAAAALAEISLDVLAGATVFVVAAVGFALLRLVGLGHDSRVRPRPQPGTDEADDAATDALRACGRAVRDAGDLDEAWARLKEASELLGIAGMELDLYISEAGAPGLEHALRHVVSSTDSPTKTVCHTIPLMDRRFLYGELAFIYPETSRPDERRRAFLYLLAEHLAELLARVYHDRAEELFTVHRHTIRRR